MKPSIKTSMKCNFSNEIHKIFNSLIPEGKQKNSYWTKRHLRQQGIAKMSDMQKIEMLNKIFETYEQASQQLANYRDNKRNKKIVQKLRVERGYVPKKKTTKEQWEQMQKDKMKVA